MLESLLDRLSNPLHQSVLRRRFFQGERFAVIAQDFKVREEEIRRLEAEALEECRKLLELDERGSQPDWLNERALAMAG